MFNTPPYPIPVSTKPDWAAKVGCIELSLNPGSPSGWSSRREGLSNLFNPAFYRNERQKEALLIPRFRFPISHIRSDQPSREVLALAMVNDCYSQAEIPVHPDAQEFFGLSKPSSHIGGFITVSSRTLAVAQNGNAAYPKLDFPHRLGRCPRRIFKNTIDKSVNSTSFLKSQFSEAQQRHPARSRFAVLPESLGFTVKANDAEIGAIFRESDPWPATGLVGSALIPFFAIPVPDKSGNCFLSWIINAMVKNDPQLSHLDAFAGIVELLADYLSFMLSIGHLHDSHAQNILLEVSPSGLPHRIVIRDLSHLYSIQQIPENRKRKKVSHLIDSKFGSYVIEPLARRFERVFQVNKLETRAAVLEQFSFLNQYAELLPSDCWYARDSTENLNPDGSVILEKQFEKPVLRNFS